MTLASNRHVQNISAIAAIISKVQELYFYLRSMGKASKISQSYFKVSLQAYYMPFSGDIVKTAMFFTKDFKYANSFRLSRTVFSQSLF